MRTIETPVVRIKEGLSPDMANQAMVLNEKLYLLLFEGEDNETEAEVKDWFFVRGAQTAYDMMYEYFVERREDETYDMLKSRIIVEASNITISSSISMYAFLKIQIERGIIIIKSDFDIDDYCQEGDEELNEETTGQ